MTDQTPDRQPITLDQIATAAAALIADARAAGLTPPFTLSCHDYGPPAAALYLYAARRDTPDIWTALQQWADRYGTQIATHPGTSPGTVHAVAAFSRDGISYEVSAVIRPDPEDDDQTDLEDAA